MSLINQKVSAPEAGPIIALSVGMKTVIIVSKCLRVTKIDQQEVLCEFHFKGVCAGLVVKKVLLQGRRELALTKGEEYLLYVRLETLESGIFKGRILKVRRLDECWDKS